ncbi:MAG: universal stress protein [Desulfobacterales bacterium]
MKKEKNILFGIDDSDFSRQALLKAGELLKKNKDFKMVLFYGVPEPDATLCSELTGQDSSAIEKQKECWNLEGQKVLEKAKGELIKTGYDPDRISTIFERKCNYPADSMLQLVDSEEIDTIALGRWGKSSVSRQIIGSVTYRLAQLANNQAVWIIDPRICSYNVMLGIVGAPISQRVVDYTVRYFGHLRQSKFTLFHVIPPFSPQDLASGAMIDIEANEDQQKIFWNKIVSHFKEYSDKVKEVAGDAREKLIKAGVPEQNVVIKIQPQKRGIARDMLQELEEGNHGILVIGRTGFKGIKESGMGSKANKLLIKAKVFNICLVN